MAKFNAGVAVEKLDYDFTDFGGGEGTVPEPSIAATNAFFKNMKGMVKEIKGLQMDLGASQIEEMSDDDLADQLDQFDEASEAAERLQRMSILNVAELCGGKREPVPDTEDEYTVVGGSPSLEDLEKLPYRVLQAFTQWLVEAIKPKRTTPVTNN